MSLLVLVMAWSLCVHGAAAENRNSTEPFLRLVDGNSRCQGRLQVERAGLEMERAGLQVQRARQDWTEVAPLYTPLSFVNRLCAELDCGSALSVEWKTVSQREAVSLDSLSCFKSSLVDCFESGKRGSSYSQELTCSDSVRLVGGRSLCSGSLQIQDQSLDGSWAGVCEGALDRRGAEVLCRELGCGAPLLQGELSPLGQTFHCEGNESKLLDCPRTGTGPEACPTLNLACTDPLRLVGGVSRCQGTMEAELRGEWRRVRPSDTWDLEAATAVCQGLDCGSAVYTEERGESDRREVWAIRTDCVKKSSAVRDCVLYGLSDVSYGLLMVCSDLLNVPEVSVSEGVWAPRAEGSVWVQMGAHFRVKCSVEPQFPGGSFQLLSPTLNLTLPAVNHSAHFLFTDAGPAHKGNYTCVYLLQVFNHKFTSNSSLYIYPGESDSQFLVRALVLLLLMSLNFIPYFFYRQATRGREKTQRARRHRAHPEEECTDVVFDQM